MNMSSVNKFVWGGFHRFWLSPALKRLNPESTISALLPFGCTNLWDQFSRHLSLTYDLPKGTKLATTVKLSVTKQFQVLDQNLQLTSCSKCSRPDWFRNCDSLSFDIYIAWSTKKKAWFPYLVKVWQRVTWAGTTQYIIRSGRKFTLEQLETFVGSSVKIMSGEETVLLSRKGSNLSTISYTQGLK